MGDAQKITAVSVYVKSSEPLIGVVLVRTVNTEIKFEITEDLAHQICTDLEHFLTR